MTQYNKPTITVVNIDNIVSLQLCSDRHDNGNHHGHNNSNGNHNRHDNPNNPWNCQNNIFPNDNPFSNSPFN